MTIRSQSQSEFGTPLQGGWLVAARVAWLAFFVIAVLTLLAVLPARWAQLTQPGPLMLANLNTLGWPVTVYATYSIATEVIFITVFLVVGLVIFIRRSDDRIALFTALMLVAFGVGNQTITPTIAALRPSPIGEFIFAFGGYAAWVTFTQFPYLFPSGRYVPGWMRLPALIWFLLCIPWNFMVGSPLDPLTWPPALIGPLLLGLWGSWLFTQVYRYRRVSKSVERQQTKWVVYALAMVVFGEMTIAIIGFSLDSRGLLYLLSGVPPTPQILAFVLIGQGLARFCFLLLPIAFIFSILRYRLWDIDLIIRRTLQYTLLTGLLALAYFVGVILIQEIFRAFTVNASSPLITVLSTLGIAALFNPLRRRVQDFIDRRFFRSKYDAEQILNSFASVARDEVELERLTAALLGVVDETMQPESVSLWLKKSS